MGHGGSVRADFSIKAETTWLIDNINDWDTFNFKRFNASLTFYYHPKFLEEIGFFVQLYHGVDYYNIYFEHRLDIIRFGIMTELLRFWRTSVTFKLYLNCPTNFAFLNFWLIKTLYLRRVTTRPTAYRMTTRSILIERSQSINYSCRRDYRASKIRIDNLVVALIVKP